MAGDLNEAANALVSALNEPVAAAACVADAQNRATAFAHADASSRFEFGSITKTMTATVLGSFVVDGAVTLDDPVGKWLDAGPNSDITLRQLATHTSGLPRLPANLEASITNELDPYANYTADLAEAALRDVTRRTDGAREYSNFGFQLLGVALERIGNDTMPNLLTARVFEPFGLTTASTDVRDGQVQGFRNGQPTPPWSNAIIGAGGVKGTVGDLAAWGGAILSPPEGVPGNPIRIAVGAGLAWQRTKAGVVWHNGATYGGRACLMVDHANSRYALAMAATFGLDHLDDAVALTLAGRDPADAIPQPVGDERNQPAVDFMMLLAEAQWDEARAQMTESCASTLTAEVLSSAWAEVMTPRGTLTATEVTKADLRDGMTWVDLVLHFEKEDGYAQVAFNPAGLIVGVGIN